MDTANTQPIYLDHNATTPLLPEVADAMRECYALPHHNPASQHAFGRRARQKIDEARDRIAELLGAKTYGMDADRILFTSGGTEANNLAVRGLLQARGTSPLATSHLIISSLEHPSIATLAEKIASEGACVDRLSADERGVIRADQLKELLRDDTRVVAVMLGQNETGVLQPVEAIAALCNARGVPLHTDAAQVAGKLPIDFRSLGVATMSIAAHKFHGPVGIGALVVRHGTELAPQLFGGFQQAGLRPGTESVALAVGMCLALEAWHSQQDERRTHLETLRDRFERQILAGWPQAVVIGAEALRLPHTSNIALVGLDRQALFIALDQAGVACSTGSACASGSSEPSPALVAMGLEKSLIHSALRFSFGVTTTRDEADEAARRILHCASHLGRQNQR